MEFNAPMDITPTNIISAQIADNSPSGREQTAFLSTIISEYSRSPSRLYMDIAESYYKNKNDILEAKRMVIGKDTENNAILVESKTLSNNKLTHNYLKKLTRQKIGYMIGKPFSLNSTVKDDERSKAMFTELGEYFTLDFYKMIKNVGRDSIVKGLGWLHVYYDEQGKLCFKRIAPEEIIPLWQDSDHTILDAVVRQFTIEQYIGGNKKLLKFVDYYNSEGVYHYKYNDDGKLIPDETNAGPDSHITAKISDSEEVLLNWSKIPFVPFKYDPDEQSLLTRFKSLNDDYDRKTSGIANNIDDFPNSMIVVKNYDGTSKEEFVHNKNQYRTLFVQGDGDAKSMETPLDVTSVELHLTRLQTDIYEFGQGVNTSDKDIRDTSGVALRFMYADLDMDCIDWSGEFQWSIMLLIWFIQQDLIAKGKDDYSDVKYNIIFNTDVIINETETIQNAFTSKGIISDKTIAENHPWTVDATKEVEAMYSDLEGTLDLESEYSQKTSNPATGQRSAK